MNSILARAFVALFLMATLPATAGLLSSPRPITYVDASNTRHIYAFARGGDGHLHAAHFNGTSWNWIDHGLPSGATSIHDPQPVTYVDGLGIRRFNIFAVDNNGRLVMRHSTGFGWQWRIQGGPELKKTSGGLSAITFVDFQGVRRIYAFGVRASDRALMSNYQVGSTWQWEDHGMIHPWDDKIAPALTRALTYEHQGDRAIDVICISPDQDAWTDTHITKLYYKGNLLEGQFQWGTLGGQQAQMALAAGTYADQFTGHRSVYFFYGLEYYASGFWMHHTVNFGADMPLGVPPGVDPATDITSLSAINFQSGARRALYAFTAIDGRLYVNYGDTTTRYWADQGKPAGFTVRDPEALTFVGDDGLQRIHVFTKASGRTESIFVNHWNGTTWQWFDIGSP